MPLRVLRCVFVVAAALAMSSSFAHAQASPLSASAGDSVRTAVPGTPLSLIFMIYAPDGIESGTAQVSLPPGWRLIIGGGPLPEATRRISYTVATVVPSSSPAGRYRVELTARGRNGGTSAGVWVIVPERREISLNLLEAPQIVTAGDRASGRFLLTNRGNVATPVQLRVRASHPYSIDTLTVSLAPGESREIAVQLHTAGAAGQAVQSVMAVSANAIGYKGVTAATSFRTTIAPREAYAPLPLHSVASGIRMIGTSSVRGGSGAEIFGAGRLRDGSATTVEYVARRISGEPSIFGDRSEYRVAVASPAYGVSIGDHVSRLSSLTENGRFARGASAQATSNGWTIGGFVNRETGFAARRQERAGFLNRDFGNGVLVGINYLDRREPRGGSLVSVHSSVRSLPFGTIEGEVGHAINSVRAEAWMVSASGAFERLSYNIHRQKADAKFPGSSAGTDAMNATVDARPVAGIRVRAALNDYSNTRGAIGVQGGRSHHWSRLASITLRNLLGLELLRNGRQDATFAQAPRRQETLAIGRIAAGFRGATISGSAGIGSATNGGERRDVSRYSAQGSMRVAKQTRVSLNVESIRGGTLFLPTEKSALRAGIGADVTTRAGSLSVTAYLTQHNLVKRLTESNAEISWSRELFSGHKASLRARLHHDPLFESPDDNVVRAEYTIPFGMPVGHSRTRGRIAGQVIESATRQGVAGVMVQLGSQITITDAKGRFAFATDSENSALLNYGGSGATAGLIPDENFPVTVYPRAGRTQNIEIALTRAAQIEGRVRVYVAAPGFRIDDERPPVEDSTVRRIRVEATRGSETRRAITGASGSFSFSGLRPGRWTLRIADEDMPAQFGINGDSVLVNAGAGATASAAIDVVPKKRRIRLVHVQ